VLKSTPKASATITGGGEDDVSVTGNKDSLKKASVGLARSVQDTLDQIAEQFGGEVGKFAVSIGIRHGDYRVDTSGSGKTKKKSGAVDFDEDQAGAIAYAVMDAITDGALIGISAAVQKALKSCKIQASEQIAAPYAARYLLWMGVITYAVWVAMFAIYRYLVPLEMLAPLLIVFAIGMLPLRAQTRGLVAGFALVILAVTVQPGNWGRTSHWFDTAVPVELPSLPMESKPMILMAGFEPYSHVVSAFPPEIPFIRIQSNFASPDQNKGINAVIQKRLEAHKGMFMLLVPHWQFNLAKDALAYFNLAFSPQTCQKVVDHLFDTKLVLCPVTRVPPKAPND
jgi:hypothetical protein